MNRRALWAVAAVTLMYGVLVGCGGRSHTVPASDTTGASVGVDRHLSEPARWADPIVLRQPGGHFEARLSSTTAADQGAARHVAVRLDGVGWPRSARADGYAYVGSGVRSAWTSHTETFSVSLTTDARRVGLVVWNLGGRWQVMVGKTALGAPQSAGSTYHHHSLDVEFPTSTSRTVTFLLSDGVYFAGLRVGGGAEHVSAGAEPGRASPSTYWLGDSYVAGGGATYPGFDDLAHVASMRAGLSDVTIDALGGTGYVASNASAHFPNYLTRAHVNLGGHRARPRLIVVGGSINDDVYGRAHVRRAAGALYAYLARALPRASVVVVPFTSGYPLPQGVADANQGILSAARAAPNVVGVLNLPAKVLALGGSAQPLRQSGGLVSSVVKYHPSEAGHLLYGGLIGTFLARCVRALNRRGPARGVCDQAD